MHYFGLEDIVHSFSNSVSNGLYWFILVDKLEGGKSEFYYLQNHCWWDTMTEELIELRPNLHDSGGWLFANYQVCDFMTIDFPVRFSNRQRTRQVWTAMQGLGDICRGTKVAYDCIFKASRTRIAFRRFPPESLTILSPASGGRSKPARLDTYWRTVTICSTRISSSHNN